MVKTVGNAMKSIGYWVSELFACFFDVWIDLLGCRVNAKLALSPRWGFFIMQIDTRELKQLELKLLRANKTGFKIAGEQTLNDLAFEARREAQAKIKREFTVRNHWTTSARNNPVDRAKRGKPFAEYGSTLGYMEKRENGAVNQPDPFTNAVAIATPVASGERSGVARGKTIRKKVIRKPNRRTQLKTPSRRLKELPRRQRNAALIQEAIKTKRRYIELERHGETNIFKVRGTKNRYKLDRIYKTEHRAIIVKPMPWLKPSTANAYKSSGSFYFKRLQYQIDRMMRM